MPPHPAPPCLFEVTSFRCGFWDRKTLNVLSRFVDILKSEYRHLNLLSYTGLQGFPRQES